MTEAKRQEITKRIADAVFNATEGELLDTLIRREMDAALAGEATTKVYPQTEREIATLALVERQAVALERIAAYLEVIAHPQQAVTCVPVPR